MVKANRVLSPFSKVIAGSKYNPAKEFKDNRRMDARIIIFMVSSSYNHLL
jgi:hypothetical protein